jgi:hypothetical protein
VLGVEPGADREVVRRAFREIAKGCHPDVTDDRWRHRLFHLAREAREQYEEWWALEDRPPAVVRYVANNPGCTSTEVLESNSEIQRRHIRRAESRGQIENRGKPHRHAWYVVEDSEREDAA